MSEACNVPVGAGVDGNASGEDAVAGELRTRGYELGAEVKKATLKGVTLRCGRRVRDGLGVCVKVMMKEHLTEVCFVVFLSIISALASWLAFGMTFVPLFLSLDETGRRFSRAVGRGLVATVHISTHVLLPA